MTGEALGMTGETLGMIRGRAFGMTGEALGVTIKEPYDIFMQGTMPPAAICHTMIS